jgi:PAS domain S-box-containing protein
LKPLRAVEGRDDVPRVVRRAVEEDRVGAVVGEGSRILAANDHFLRLIDFSRDELDAGTVSWLRLTPPEWLSSDARAIGQARAGGRSEPYEKEFERRDGTRVRVRIATVLVRLEPFRVFAVVSAAGDAEGARFVDALAESPG